MHDKADSAPESWMAENWSHTASQCLIWPLLSKSMREKRPMYVLPRLAKRPLGTGTPKP